MEAPTEQPQPNADALVGMPTWKRMEDLLLVLVLLPVLLTVGGLIALAVWMGSRGPILFQQRRIGCRGRVFTCYKFRTMHVNADQGTHREHVQELMRKSVPMTKLDAGNKDARLIRGGSWIRASGLDELPQIINVIRGDMSIIGPRPCIPYEFDLYEPWQKHRFDAAPGLTGLWQVSGKNRTTFEEMVRLDIRYAREMSPWLDARILLLTLPAILQQVRDMWAAKRARKSTAQPAGVPADAQTSIPKG